MRSACLLLLLPLAAVAVGAGESNCTPGTNPFQDSIGGPGKELHNLLGHFGTCDKRVKTELTSQSRKLFASSLGDFTWRLYQHAVSEAWLNDENFVLSPVSLSIALELLYEGAAGQTAAEFETLLFGKLAPDDTRKAYASVLNYLKIPAKNERKRLYTANLIYTDDGYDLDQGYRNLLANCFSTPIVKTNIRGNPEATRVSANDAISNWTHGKINSILGAGSVTAATKLILINGLYFKADWADKFTKGDTIEFRGVPVPMMLKDGSYPYHQSRKHGVKVLGLPYECNEQMMVVLLPTGARSLRQLEERLDSRALRDLMLRMKEEYVSVALPNFTISTTVDMQRHLRDMGLHTVFAQGAADLSNMMRPRGNEAAPFLSTVAHKAVIEVTKDGTEGVGATGFSGVSTSHKEQFIVDRPFLFLVRDIPTDTILFMGRVTNPKPKLRRH